MLKSTAGLDDFEPCDGVCGIAPSTWLIVWLSIVVICSIVVVALKHLLEIRGSEQPGEVGNPTAPALSVEEIASARFRDHLIDCVKSMLTDAGADELPALAIARLAPRNDCAGLLHCPIKEIH